MNASRHWLVCAQAAITLRSRRRSGSMRPSASVAPPSGGGASVHLAHGRERVLPLRLARARRDLAVVAHEIRPARADAAHSHSATIPPINMWPSVSVAPPSGGGASVHLAHERERVLPLRLARTPRPRGYSSRGRARARRRRALAVPHAVRWRPSSQHRRSLEKEGRKKEVQYRLLKFKNRSITQPGCNFENAPICLEPRL